MSYISTISRKINGVVGADRCIAMLKADDIISKSH